jgi:nucleoside-diphosphate-sugar epimerase
MSGRHILVTGGSGFIGSALVQALVKDGNKVRVLDDNSRGAARRLAAVERDIEFVAGDVRDASAVLRAARGVDELHHLAYVNGTEHFYKSPELVLDVGVKGMINVIDACREAGVRTLVLASSSEVYQTPPKTPTDETAPLIVPDPTNPRYSYGGGKIISELMAINYGRKFFDRVLIFRPHNVYGPDMGFEHVIPQFALRFKRAAAAHPNGKVPFEIQGDGSQTRSFCHVGDLVQGVMAMRAKGEHLGIYHVGTTEEISIAELARRVASHGRRDIGLIAGPAPEGGTERRCPDISKLARLGYKPAVPLADGLPPTLDWYWANEHLAPPPRA